MNILEIIERKAGVLKDDECWETSHRSASTGYCRVKQQRLHRVAYEAHHAEPIPDGMMVCHTCDNRRCFNPAHLFLGSAKNNHDDCVAKGRFFFTSRPRQYDYSLIHQLHTNGLTIQQIATEIGADWSTVERVIKEQLPP